MIHMEMTSVASHGIAYEILFASFVNPKFTITIHLYTQNVWTDYVH